MMTDGDYTFGGDHFVVYTDDTVKCCIPETDIIYQCTSIKKKIIVKKHNLKC